ncbi:Rne/Rng family ribonuclease [Sabulicella rubraurantiaca]|uniref:Rne/Rng family ribonuclease n=1 Tax=Sabulicella rubraurantiaca TaxID=2811429 RepID=UPI001A979E04|nr:ribonuclease E/G [Sabulicella rubraurantiaca]
MTKRMLIDAAHPEETRVVVMDNSRVDEFDLEAANRLPLKGNIYLARVVRVEPSLQAAFVEYGGNRHGFLAFGEIHPDYYQIPVADRQRLIEMQEAEAREEAEAEAREEERRSQREAAAAEARAARRAAAEAVTGNDAAPAAEDDTPALPGPDAAFPAEEAAPDTEALSAELDAEAASRAVGDVEAGDAESDENGRVELLPSEDSPPPETIGEETNGENGESSEGSDEESRPRRREAPRFLRNYKIQEVIRRRQILLVQVVKEERGNKGAALTTYISLAGRFSVLMPNSPRGGGVSRKITSSTDRRRLREVIEELEMPRGMSLIVRTAGAQRPKAEIRRDCEYLLQLWDNIRTRTLASTAPALIYEEADLIKRAIRDGYARDMDEILVEGDEAYIQAREFMRMLMPEHLRKIQPYRDGTVPLFARYSVETQLDAMHEPTVQLRSGGYIVINQTEALVAIDVNSGRATRERNIEDTALKTNLEAAEEIARQLRLRDLAGLIVVDFIDMDSNRHNAMVEKRMKEALRHDRARIQVGRISHFGLLEMSRQRLRPSLNETAFITCPHCLGRGTVRGLESSAVAVLRAVEEECARRRAAEVTVHVRSAVALYLLNKKRERLNDIEARWGVSVIFECDDTLHGAETRIERSRAPAAPPREEERPAAIRMDYAADAEEGEDEAEEAGERETSEAGDSEERSRRRRRRRRGRREGGEAQPSNEREGQASEEQPAEAGDVQPEQPEGQDVAEEPTTTETEEERSRRRRGRRGGRRRREDGAPPEAQAEAVQAMEVVHRSYSGPTPADPFAGHEDHLIAAMEAAEAAAAEALTPRQPEPVVMPENAASPAPEEPKASETPAKAAAPEPQPAPSPVPAAEAAEPAKAEVTIGPAIQPKSVEELATSPRRGGWWKR